MFTFTSPAAVKTIRDANAAYATQYLQAATAADKSAEIRAARAERDRARAIYLAAVAA